MLKLSTLRARLYTIRFELLMLSLWCIFILFIFTSLSSTTYLNTAGTMTNHGPISEVLLVVPSDQFFRFIAILLVLASWREQRRLQGRYKYKELIFHDLGEITRILNTEIGTPTHTFLPKTFRGSDQK